MTEMTEEALRAAMIAGCRALNAQGINQGTSGNISLRLAGRILITPSGIPYDDMMPATIASRDLVAEDGAVWQGPERPSSEWPFHVKLLRARPEMAAVVHAHPPHATALAMARMEIPACHYMVAAFGGNSVRCAGYATFGTAALADLALEALQDRSACLLANHGCIALGESLDRALWRMVELEALARQYLLSLQADGPVLLSDSDIEETLRLFEDYGPKDGVCEV
ncbi:MAG TPA: class II aldolase/adducin family protein [Kiloniellaceae bacterium]|nr:class II aldolase/adducin family protein [Kiloniellaceae bacterium]